MGALEITIALLIVIICVSVLAKRVPAPPPLLLVLAGMLLSMLPNIPAIELNPELVLGVFLPLLIYETSAITSWRDVKRNIRPIALLSVGHVIFITILVAIAAHTLIPGMSWPMAFVLGAVVSPPDDVAIVAVAEKIQMPQRILTVLTGEGLLNDATALILFRFSLAALLTHQFSPVKAVSAFFAILICETLYGLFVGHVVGRFRIKLRDARLQIMTSILTPFIAYLPAVYFGGSGILATVVTGLVIGHSYLGRYTPEARLLGRSVWDMVGFTLQSILFLLVGLNFSSTLSSMSSLSGLQLLWYGTAMSLVVIIGRFIWVFPAAYLPRFLFTSLRKKEPYPPWQYTFVISWAGMRGGVSLAAALAVPSLTLIDNGTELRHLLIFLVFCVITATLLIQGLTLPWILNILGLKGAGLRENEHEKLDELTARLAMVRAVVRWLTDYKKTIDDDTNIFEEVKLQLLEYEAHMKRLKDRLSHYQDNIDGDKKDETVCADLISTQIIEVERSTLAKLWHKGKITYKTKTKLLQQLDLRSRHTSGLR